MTDDALSLLHSADRTVTPGRSAAKSGSTPPPDAPVIKGRPASVDVFEHSVPARRRLGEEARPSPLADVARARPSQLIQTQLAAGVKPPTPALRRPSAPQTIEPTHAGTQDSTRLR